MQIKLVVTAQRVYTFQLSGGTASPVDAPSAPNPADVSTVSTWALGESPERTFWVEGVVGDNGCTLEINITQDDFDSRNDGNSIYMVTATADEPTVTAPVATALQNIINDAYTP